MDSHNYTPIDFLLPIAAPHKEAEPIRTKSEAQQKLEIHEVIEHQPSPEVAPFVDHHKETIDVPPDLKQIGVVSTGQPTVTATSPINIPLTDDKIVSGLHQPITSSLRWFAEFCLYLLKTVHVSLKEIQGKPVRNRI